MFAFTFVRGLFKFNADAPAFEVLLQLPPTIGKRFVTYPHGKIISRLCWFLSAILSSRPEAFLSRITVQKSADNAFHQ